MVLEDLVLVLPFVRNEERSDLPLGGDRQSVSSGRLERSRVEQDLEA